MRRPIVRLTLTGRGLVILTVAAVLLVGLWFGHGGIRTRTAARPAPAPTPLPVPFAPSGGAILGPASTDPLFASDLPDPYIVRVGRTYFMYGTAAFLESTNIPLWVSQDLVHWRSLGDAMPTLPGWALAGRTWAPSVLVRSDSYVMYFTAEQRSSGRQCIGTARAHAAAGPFIPDPQLLECQVARHAGSIDGEIFVDADGSPYLMWKSDDNAVHRPSTLWAQRLSPDGTHFVGTAVAMLRDDRPWEGYTIEAPAMVHTAGHYWLFYSGNYLASTKYAIGYALCAGPLGPCAKQSVDAPWYASGPEGQGPGEESFFTDGVGRTYMAYNAWPSAGAGYPHGVVRFPHIDLVRFQSSAPPSLSPATAGMALSPLRGYYVLTSDGMVWPEGGAISFGHEAIAGELARGIAVMPDGLGYVVVDGHGGIHRFGSARLLPTDPSITWPGADIARGIAITPSGKGYAVLDDQGGVHPVGDAPPAPPRPGETGDAERALVISPSDGGYALLGADGSVQVSGDVPSALARPATGFWPSVSLAMTPSGLGYATLDTNGDIAVVGDAPPPPPGEPTILAPVGRWVALVLRPDRHYVAVRSDSSVTTW